MPDILVVDNYHESVVCGDIHGNSERGGLNDVLKSLGPIERLVIVGDLVDRGPDSFGYEVITQKYWMGINGKYKQLFW